MRVFHVTSRATADAIQSHGFRDSETYIGGLTLNGTWLADRPLTVLDTSRDGDWVLALDVPANVLEGCEIEEPGKGYREWCVPSAALNGLPITASRPLDP